MLKPTVENPFLRANPFKISHEHFYSAPKKYKCSQYNQYKQKQQCGVFLLSQNNNEQNEYSSYLKISRSQTQNQLKKKSNPFFRKYLIGGSKQNQNNYNQFEQSSSTKPDNYTSRPKPNFLSASSQTYSKTPLNNSPYRQLSYQAPPQTQTTKLAYQLNPSNSVPSVDNKQYGCYQNGGLGLVFSPRFPSVKFIDKQNLYLITSPQKQLINRKKYNFVNEIPTSQKQISMGNIHIHQSQKDSNCFQKQYQIQKQRKELAGGGQGDRFPEIITVRYNRYYRNKIQIVEK